MGRTGRLIRTAARKFEELGIPGIVTGTLVVSGRELVLPTEPVVAVCLDGMDRDYLDAARAEAPLPFLDHCSGAGFYGMARGALPSFTNVNNVSLVTAAPPSVHGISGNYFLDPLNGEAVMMNDPAFLWVETLLAAAARAGRRVALVTAKEKLRRLLTGGMNGIALSTERLQDARAETHGVARAVELLGRPAPEVYSADASLAVLDLGLALLTRGLADLLYLSLTDYIQHVYPPEAPAAIAFVREVDARLAELARTGARVGATADHGMSAKHDPADNPNVLYLAEQLAERWGPGPRVILPITDPYVVHHGALGGCAHIYLPEPEHAEEVAAWLATLPGISGALPRAAAAHWCQQPPDRIGDVMVFAEADSVLGLTPADHDLSLLHGPLRSHGGPAEQMVPFLLTLPRTPYLDPVGLRNFDLLPALLSDA